VFILRRLPVVLNAFTRTQFLNSFSSNRKVEAYDKQEFMIFVLAMDGADSKKLVQVENEKDTFAPPELFLVAFLRKKRRARRAARHGDDNWEQVEGGEL